ncbi:MAG TPA: hypothetical protein VNG35_03735 [Gemmatimonadales bacterium]|nr:hypothetical protein [Gemmatimonadales bacterium]
MAGPALVLVWLLAAAQPDSQAALRSAQRAQQAFESRRGFLAPRTPGSRVAVGDCDEKIGRFCYWYGDDRVPLPREPDEIKIARKQLLDLLDSAAAELPGDWWIAGQRVRYLVESERYPEAYAAARACRAEPWWCEALEGFARHEAGDDAGADTVYAAAVADMPEGLRCRWTDLTPLLDGALRKRFTRLDCAARAAVSARLWWLAQPLLSRPGNDRRVEHFARLTMVRMLEHAGSAWASPLADDLRELTLRYGWPVAWSQALTDELNDTRDVTGHERVPAFHFFPDLEPTHDPRVAAWTLQPPRPHERYAPLYATTFEALAPDFAIFRRPDSTVLVVAFDLTRDTLWQGAPPQLVAVLAADERTAPVLARDERSPPRGVVVAAAPWPASFAGFEVTREPLHRAGRARVALLPRDSGTVQLSDALVFDPVGAVDSLPQRLDLVLPFVHGPGRVASGARIGLYWEVYGLAQSEPIETSVGVTPLKAGLLHHIGGWIGLGKRRQTSLAWREAAQPERGVVGRAVALDVASLDPGRYRVAVTVRARGHDVTTARELEIVRP